MLSVATRRRVDRNNRSHCSTASQRSSSGVRFHRPQVVHTTHSLPFTASNAIRRPIASVSIDSLRPRSAWQKRQVEYIASYICGDACYATAQHSLSRLRKTIVQFPPHRPERRPIHILLLL